jgi:hypothetical protein
VSAIWFDAAAEVADTADATVDAVAATATADAPAPSVTAAAAVAATAATATGAAQAPTVTAAATVTAPAATATAAASPPTVGTVVADVVGWSTSLLELLDSAASAQEARGASTQVLATIGSGGS